MADKFKGFWMMEAGERDERYLHPATPEDVATQLRAMGYSVFGPYRSAIMRAYRMPPGVVQLIKESHESKERKRFTDRSLGKGW